MSKARHKRASGGKAGGDWYEGGESPTAKEAEEKKKGGAVRHHGEGEHAKARHDRPGRKRGGRIGADKMPLSSAAKIHEVVPHEEPPDSPKDGHLPKGEPMKRGGRAHHREH